MSATTPPGRAVVTGASNGIGLELAKLFAAAGYDLLLAAESDRLQAAADGIRAGAPDITVETVQVDLATYDGVAELASHLLPGGVTAAAINAGVGIGGRFATETSLEDELRLIRLNVEGAVHLTKRVVEAMIARGKGQILITSSIAGTHPTPYEAVYGASKTFLGSFAQAIRAELEDTGITVTSLMPGPTETDFFHRAGMDDTKIGASEKQDAAELRGSASRRCWRVRTTWSPASRTRSWRRPPGSSRTPRRPPPTAS